MHFTRSLNLLVFVTLITTAVVCKAQRTKVSFYCPAGTHCRNLACTSCQKSDIICPPGQFYTQISGTCQFCQVGSFASSPGQESCFECAAGSYCDHTGCTGCDLCAAGQFSDRVGSPTCKECTLVPRRNQNSMGRSSCVYKFCEWFPNWCRRSL
jgi:hypothetical protein